MAIKQVIEERFDQLEILLKEGRYEEATLLLPNLTKFYSIFSEEQRDFINAALSAVDNNEEWK
jgi:hypothetical protein